MNVRQAPPHARNPRSEIMPPITAANARLIETDALQQTGRPTPRADRSVPLRKPVQAPRSHVTDRATSPTSGLHALLKTLRRAPGVVGHRRTAALRRQSSPPVPTLGSPHRWRPGGPPAQHRHEQSRSGSDPEARRGAQRPREGLGCGEPARPSSPVPAPIEVGAIGTARPSEQELPNLAWLWAA